MDTITLRRDSTSDAGTFGVLVRNGEQIAVTCELPWRDNHPDTSCIPAGAYPCAPHNSPAHPHTWEVTNVPHRGAILIHNGNTENDSKGCILVGDSFGVIAGKPAVLNSVATLNKLRLGLPRYFNLKVIDV
jgi:hypothetical protein